MPQQDKQTPQTVLGNMAKQLNSLSNIQSIRCLIFSMAQVIEQIGRREVRAFTQFGSSMSLIENTSETCIDTGFRVLSYILPSYFSILSIQSMDLLSLPKESIHLKQSQILKIEGGQRKSRGCSTPTIDRWYNGQLGTLPTFHLAPLSFEYLARQKCILSFGETVGIETACLPEL